MSYFDDRFSQEPGQSSQTLQVPPPSRKRKHTDSLPGETVALRDMRAPRPRVRPWIRTMCATRLPK